jgi:thiamine-phosphate pyrophosphorylase
MPGNPILCYITDRSAFGEDEAFRCRALLDKIFAAASAGVDYIQLREKNLPARDLERLARQAMQTIAKVPHPRTSLLMNSRMDVALAVSAAGVHLPGNDITPLEAFDIWNRSPDSSSRPVISVACHSPEEVAQAASKGASLALFAPMFEKKDAPASQSQGLSALRQACRSSIPVLALGGITVENAESCLQAGAAGLAAIRLFQENDVDKTVIDLRRVGL